MRDCLSSATTEHQTIALGRRLEASEFQPLLLETLQMKKKKTKQKNHTQQKSIKKHQKTQGEAHH